MGGKGLSQSRGVEALEAGQLSGRAPFDASVICQQGDRAGTLVPISLKEDEGAYAAP
jgi:hypothetical protein